MSTIDWAGLCVSIITILSCFIVCVRWLVKHYLSELKPNSGSSLVDKVNRLELRVDDIYRLLVEK